MMIVMRECKTRRMHDIATRKETVWESYWRRLNGEDGTVSWQSVDIQSDSKVPTENSYLDYSHFFILMNGTCEFSPASSILEVLIFVNELVTDAIENIIEWWYCSKRDDFVRKCHARHSWRRMYLIMQIGGSSNRANTRHDESVTGVNVRYIIWSLD